MRDDAHRVRFAFAVAPLAAPIAVFAGSLVRAVVGTPPFAGPAPATPASLFVLLWAFVLFGAPLAYAATAVVLWPATLLLERWHVLRWWTLSAIGAVAGSLMLRGYTHMLQPRGSVDLFPGAGAIAGAAVAITLWSVGFRSKRG